MFAVNACPKKSSMKAILSPAVVHFNRSPPDHPSFEEAMMMDVFDIVLSRQMHSEHHNPTCFKYGSRTKCRFQFPRKLIPHTVFDEAMGVILQQRDCQWLNNYNPWFSLAMQTNHDCQYLFTQIHALAIIYHTMKYISKAEENAHSKLTIAATVARALATSKPDGRDEGKSMLIKTYKKLSSHREVGIPEAISHLLDSPDALFSGTFQNIHTTHLLNHVKALNSGQDDLTPTDMGDSSILRVRNSVVLLSLFDDYAHRGPSLANCHGSALCHSVRSRRCSLGLFWSRHMLRTRAVGAWRMAMNSTERSHKP